MAFKRLNNEDLAKLALVKDVTLEELTELITNKDNFLKRAAPVEDLLNSNGEPGTFTYVDKNGKVRQLEVPLLTIVPIPSIPIDTIPSFDKQY